MRGCAQTGRAVLSSARQPGVWPVAPVARPSRVGCGRECVVGNIAPAAALLCACGAEFIEPNPPQLVRTRVDYQASSAAEPAVWVVVSDLFLEHDEDCAATVAWLGASIRGAVPPPRPGPPPVAPRPAP